MRNPSIAIKPAYDDLAVVRALFDEYITAPGVAETCSTDPSTRMPSLGRKILSSARHEGTMPPQLLRDFL